MSQDSASREKEADYSTSVREVAGSPGTPRDYDVAAVPEVMRGTVDDQADMYRLGKKPELRRNFRFVSILGFMMVLQSTWESALLASQYGLYNGGTAGVIWATIGVWICSIFMIASMAEMASMAPTAGGQYHWVSEFAPPSVQKPLSYIVGWMCCLGWVSGIPAGAYILYSLIEGMTLVYAPNADITALWQGTLILFAWAFLVVGFNVFFAQQLPLAEGLVLVLHIFGFFAFLIVFWVMGKHQSASEVFTTFYDGGNWGSNGLSTLVGLTTPLWCFIGPDAGAHMSEELKDSSLTLPRGMMTAIIANGIFGVVMLITFCFCLNQDMFYPEFTLWDGTPVITVLKEVTGSNAGTIIMGSILFILNYFAAVSNVASASRQCWAFARDQGFPFSKWIQFVRPGWDIPLNSIIVCLAITLILGAINFGSNDAFNAILSISNAALIFSYICSIGCVRLKRLRGEPLLPRRWSLGKWGGPINDVALGFLIISFIFSFFPTDTLPVLTAAYMNWACLLFGATCILAGGYYVVYARKTYVPPVVLVKKEW